jgi:small subunit ribosomal protein S16
MPVKIRLQRHGRKKHPFYHIVVADSRTPRDGKFIEKIGTYNPQTIPATIDLNVDKAVEWMNKGAQPSDTANRILSYKGVLYKRHLLRGVAKGVVPAEAVEAKWNEFLESHSASVAVKKEEQMKKKLAVKHAQKVTAKVVAEVIEEPIVEAPAPTVEEVVAPVAEAPAAPAEEAPAAPEAPAAE